MAEGIDGSFDAAFFTGYHGGVGTQNATLDHTYTSETLRETRVNGSRCNEAMLNAAVLGLDGVPVVLITGDRACIDADDGRDAVADGRRRERLDRPLLDELPLTGARARAHPSGCANRPRSLSELRERRPFTFTPPITLEIDFNSTHNADFVDMMPGFERIGARSVRFVHDDFRVDLQSLRRGVPARRRRERPRMRKRA